MNYLFHNALNPVFGNLVCKIVLCKQMHCFCLHSQVDIFGDKYYCSFRVLLGEPFGGGKDSVILSIFKKRFGHSVAKWVAELNFNHSFVFADGYSVVKQLIVCYFVHLTHKLSGVKV